MDGAELFTDLTETTGATRKTLEANEFQPFDGNQIASLQSQLRLLQDRVKVWPSTLISTSIWLLTKWRSTRRATAVVSSQSTNRTGIGGEKFEAILSTCKLLLFWGFVCYIRTKSELFGFHASLANHRYGKLSSGLTKHEFVQRRMNFGDRSRSIEKSKESGTTKKKSVEKTTG